MAPELVPAIQWNFSITGEPRSFSICIRICNLLRFDIACSLWVIQLEAAQFLLLEKIEVTSYMNADEAFGASTVQTNDIHKFFLFTVGHFSSSL